MQVALKKNLGIHFSLEQFYRSPTIRALAAARPISSAIELAVKDAQAALNLNDAQAALNLNDAQAACAEPTIVSQAVLTGATGFLGMYLLNQLSVQLDRIFCLVRCENESKGMKKLQTQAHQAQLNTDFRRVQVIPADLSKPALGLSQSNRDLLVQQADCVLHCAAQVHHLCSYEALRQTNVLSLQELLQLTVEKKMKKFCFISTLGAGAMVEGESMIREEVVPGRPLIDNGYLLSKWAGEQLLARFQSQTGIPAVIARPGNITGDSTTGYSHYEKNHFWLFNQGCIQLGAYPDDGSLVEMTPVDQVARAIVALISSMQPGLWVANLDNPETLSQMEFFEKLEGYGLVARPVSPKVWLTELETIEESNALNLLKDFHRGQNGSQDRSGAVRIERQKTKAALIQRGIRFSQDIHDTQNYDRWIQLYVSFLAARGFFKLAQTPQAKLTGVVKKDRSYSSEARPC
jgi:thioester reductase-like protein